MGRVVTVRVSEELEQQIVHYMRTLQNTESTYEQQYDAMLPLASALCGATVVQELGVELIEAMQQREIQQPY